MVLKPLSGTVYYNCARKKRHFRVKSGKKAENFQEKPWKVKMLSIWKRGARSQ
jgi:hypothetical protein